MKLGYKLFFVSVFSDPNCTYIMFYTFKNFKKQSRSSLVINLIKIFQYSMYMYVSTIAVNIYHHKRIHLHSICTQCYKNSIPTHQLWLRIVVNS